MRHAQRDYECMVCGHKQKVGTNHLGTCFANCEGCTWKAAGFDPTSRWDNSRQGRDWPRFLGAQNTMMFQGKAYRRFKFVGNVIQEVVDELNAQGVLAHNEHPGVVHIPLARSRCGVVSLWAGTANATWMIDHAGADQRVLDTTDLGIPSDSLNVDHIVRDILKVMRGGYHSEMAAAAFLIHTIYGSYKVCAVCLPHMPHSERRILAPTELTGCQCENACHADTH